MRRGRSAGGAGGAALGRAGCDRGGGKEGGGRGRATGGRGGPRRGGGRGGPPARREPSRRGRGGVWAAGARGRGGPHLTTRPPSAPGACRAVRGSGRAAPAPPPLSPPPTAGPRPAGPFPPRAPGHSLCKRRPSKGWGSLPNRCAYLGAWPTLPSQGPRKGPEQGWRPRQPQRGTKGQRPEWRWDGGRTRAKRRALCGGRLCVPSAVPSPS